jgi:hypothetical protein
MLMTRKPPGLIIGSVNVSQYEEDLSIHQRKDALHTLSNEVWRRPYTQGNAVWLYVRQKLAGIATVDVVWLKERHITIFWMICCYRV